jgi:hypothetical protein
VTSTDYGLFFTSGFHRLGGFCRSRESLRRPNDTQSATSNCNTHDPVTRGLHRQHLVHLQFVRMWSKVGFTSWTRLFAQRGPRWAGSGSGPWGPQPTPWPTAAPGGAGREGVALHRPYGGGCGCTKSLLCPAEVGVLSTKSLLCSAEVGKLSQRRWREGKPAADSKARISQGKIRK